MENNYELNTDHLVKTIGLAKDDAEFALKLFLVNAVRYQFDTETLQEHFNYTGPYIVNAMRKPCSVCGCEESEVCSWHFKGEQAEKLGARPGKNRIVFLSVCAKCFNNPKIDHDIFKVCAEDEPRQGHYFGSDKKVMLFGNVPDFKITASERMEYPSSITDKKELEQKIRSMDFLKEYLTKLIPDLLDYTTNCEILKSVNSDIFARNVKLCDKQQKEIERLELMIEQGNEEIKSISFEARKRSNELTAKITILEKELTRINNESREKDFKCKFADELISDFDIPDLGVLYRVILNEHTL